MTSLKRKVMEVEGNIKICSNDGEQLTQFFYGKSKIHCAYAEDYGIELNENNYYSVESASDLYSDLTSDVKDCVNDMLDCVETRLANENVADKTDNSKWKRGKRRMCDSACIIPDVWGQKMHQTLTTFVENFNIEDETEKENRAEINIKEVQSKYCELEFCLGCYLSTNGICLCKNDCTDFLNFVNKLSTHFTGVRSLKRQLYSIRQCVNWLQLTDSFLLNANYKCFLDILNDPRSRPCPVQRIIETENSASDCPTEQELEDKFGHLFNVFEEKLKNYPKHVCTICQRWAKDVSEFNESESVPGYLTNQISKSVIDDVLQYSIFPIKICRNDCLKHLKKGEIPPYSRANNMWVDELPEELACLNLVELNLIRLARVYHNIIKLRPYRQIIGPQDFVDAIKGYSIHFPSPVDATTNYLMQTLPSEHSLQILVDCIPTKSSVVWRSMVNLENVFKALRKLIEINHLYKNVVINNSFSKLSDCALPIIFCENSNVPFVSENNDINSVCNYTCGTNVSHNLDNISDKITCTKLQSGTQITPCLRLYLQAFANVLQNICKLLKRVLYKLCLRKICHLLANNLQILCHRQR
jgi:hypothetical protein